MFNPFDVPGLRYVGQVSHPQVNNGEPVPQFEPVAPEGKLSINTLEGWNKYATEGNRRAFYQVFGRKPVCDAELRAWEKSDFSKDFRWEGIA